MRWKCAATAPRRSMNIVRHCTIVLSLIALMNVAAGAVPTVSRHHVTQKLLGGRHIVNVDYPQLAGLSAVATEKSINAMLAKSWPKEDLAAADIDDGVIVKDDVNYTVHLNVNDLLSVEYSGLSVPTRNGVISAAHPSKLIKSLTIDLRNGHVYTYKELFKSGSVCGACVELVIFSRAHLER